MSSALRCVLIVLGGYLLGSFSTGLLISRLTHGPDLYHVGSGNTGATNVSRSIGLAYGLITFLGDALKAVLACLLGWWLLEQRGSMLGGLFAVVGHNWPVFHRFRGGKGASSTCGTAVFCFPLPALISFVLAVLGIAVTKFVSVGSMLVAVSYCVLLWILHWGDWFIMIWAALLAAMLLLRHKENIRRLMNGTERKFSVKKKAADPE